MDDNKEIPLWWFSTAIHHQIEEQQQDAFDNGHGYMFTDDDRAIRARSIVDRAIEQNGVSEELGHLILAKYYQDYIRDL